MWTFVGDSKRDRGKCRKNDCFCRDKKKPLFFSQVFVFVVIKIGRDNGLHPTLSEQQCAEQEDLRNIVLSNIAVNYTIADLWSRLRDKAVVFLYSRVVSTTSSVRGADLWHACCVLSKGCFKGSASVHLNFFYLHFLKGQHAWSKCARRHILTHWRLIIDVCATKLTGFGTDQNQAPPAVFVRALYASVPSTRTAVRVHSFVECRPAHVDQCATVAGASLEHLLRACWRARYAMTEEHKTGWEAIGALLEFSCLLSPRDTSCPDFFSLVLIFDKDSL